MAHHGRVVRKSDIPRVVLVVVAARCTGLIVDNKGALHIDAHGAWVQNGVVDVGLRRWAARVCSVRDGRCVGDGRGSSSSGFTRRGVQLRARRRHGYGSGPWLQPRPFSAVQATRTPAHSVRFCVEAGCWRKRMGEGRCG